MTSAPAPAPASASDGITPQAAVGGMLHRVSDRSLMRTVAVVGLVVASIGCGDGSADSASSSTGDVRLNDIQVIGAHNSYHVAPVPPLLSKLSDAAEALDAEEALGDPELFNYTHPPLADQLDAGNRAFELDVYADPDGGLFAEPLGPSYLDVESPAPTGMDEPGFKVLHVNDIDYRSTCTTLVACVGELSQWSRENPDHVPIFVMIEIKDEPLPEPVDITKVVEVGTPELDALDAEIRSVVDDDQLLTPDDVRGDAATLNEVIRADGWPTLDDARGTLVFFMDNADKRDAYLRGHPNLEGRVLFTNAEAGEPDSAILLHNDPDDGREIRSLVADGYIVRTLADTVAGVTNPDGRDRDIAFASGAHVIHSDAPVGEPTARGYEVRFDGPQPGVRCNVVTAPPRCASSLE